jgi:hypothetical protein
MQSAKHFSTVFFEALVVGLGLLVLFFILQKLFPRMSLPSLLFIAGALFHLVCEYTGVNQWYSIKYCNLLK